MFHTFVLYAFASSLFANLADCSHNANSSSGPVQQLHLTLPFNSRSQAGVISIDIQPNNDDQHAFGLDLLIPGVSQSELAAEFGGFPVVHGAITYPIPASQFSGYGSLFGWIQFVNSALPGETGDWAMDLFPFQKGLDNPFGYWGFNPSLFDAPAIEGGRNQTGGWTAQAYLTVLGDAGGSRNVTVIPGGAFTWGFDIEVDKDCPLQNLIIIRQPEMIAVESEWPQRLPLLEESFPDWAFNEVN